MRLVANCLMLTLASCSVSESTRVTVNTGGTTLRELFESLERQTGYSISKDCECEMLQEAKDRSLPNIRGRLPFGKVLRIAAAAAMRPGAHCGGWVWGDGVVILYCGLPPSP